MAQVARCTSAEPMRSDTLFDATYLVICQVHARLGRSLLDYWVSEKSRCADEVLIVDRKAGRVFREHYEMRSDSEIRDVGISVSRS